MFPTKKQKDQSDQGAKKIWMTLISSFKVLNYID